MSFLYFFLCPRDIYLFFCSADNALSKTALIFRVWQSFELIARVKTWILFSSADNEYNYVPTHQEIVLSFDRELSFYLDTLTRNSYFFSSRNAVSLDLNRSIETVQSQMIQDWVICDTSGTFMRYAKQRSQRRAPPRGWRAYRSYLLVWTDLVRRYQQNSDIHQHLCICINTVFRCTNTVPEGSVMKES